jgi:hypothetical protein
MSLAVSQRAKKLFKRDHPGRFWDLIAIKSTGGRDRSATVAERRRYLAQARDELLSEEKEAASNAPRS